MISLADIITTLMTRDGLFTAEDFDVTDLTGIEFLGYRRGQGDLGGDMDLLRKIGLFDIVEADTKLFFVRRGAASVATINASDLGAFDPNDGQGLPPPDVTTSMMKETELPARITVKYRSPTREYENATQASPYRLVTDTRSEQTVEIAASLSDDHAAQLADILLRNAWAERVRYETQLDSAFAYLRASNPILLPVDGRNRRCRIVSADDADLLLRKLTLVADDDGAYVSTAVGVAPPSPPPLTGVSDTLAVLLDLPKLNDADENIGFYLALYPERPAAAWPGGELYSAYFGTEEIVGFTGSAASVGTVDSPAGSGITTTWDTANTIEVIVPSTVSLASKTDVELISDFTANLFAVGVHGRWEVAQFLDAELIATDSGTGDKTYRLSNLLRGRRGTEWAVGTGMADDTFVLLDDAITRVPLSISLLNVSVDYRPITAGDDYSSGSDQTFASAGMALKPFSPVDIVGEWTGGDVTITWKRRTRYIGDVPDAGGDVELGEESESYDVELYVSSVLVDSGTVTSASFASSAGTEGVTEVRVYQNSALVGRGTVGVAIV